MDKYAHDCPFEAYVTNLGLYNEGELVGEWVKFPTDSEHFKEVLNRIGIGKTDDFGQPYEEYFISDYDCYVHGIYNCLTGFANVDELNYLASLIENMSGYEFNQFQAGLDMEEYNSSLKDLINLAQNDSYYFVRPNITNETELGYEYIHESERFHVKGVEELFDYINYSGLGDTIAINDGGSFTNHGYVTSGSEPFIEYYDGTRADIPAEYLLTSEEKEVFKLTVLIVEPGKAPYVKEIDPGLESLQHEVDGWIQAVYPFDDPVALICNDEGKLLGMDLNRALRDDQGRIYDVVAGTFMITGLSEDNFASLSPELIDKYTKEFKHPEMFIPFGGVTRVIELVDERNTEDKSLKFER